MEKFIEESSREKKGASNERNRGGGVGWKNKKNVRKKERKKKIK